MNFSLDDEEDSSTIGMGVFNYGCIHGLHYTIDSKRTIARELNWAFNLEFFSKIKI